MGYIFNGRKTRKRVKMTNCRRKDNCQKSSQHNTFRQLILHVISFVSVNNTPIPDNNKYR